MTQSEELEALIAEMDAEQRLRFKKSLVRQSIELTARRLPPEAEDEGHRSGIQLAEAWLADPTPERARSVTVTAAAECWDGGVRYHDYPPEFLGPAWTVGEEDLQAAARHAANCAPPEEAEAALARQIAAARDILHGSAG